MYKYLISIFLLISILSCQTRDSIRLRKISSIDSLRSDSSCSNLFREFFVKIKSVESSIEFANKVKTVMSKSGLSHEKRAKEVYFLWIENIGKELPREIKEAWIDILPKDPSIIDPRTLFVRIQEGYRFKNLDENPFVVGPFVRSDERAYFDLAVYLHEAIHALESVYVKKHGYREMVHGQKGRDAIKILYYSERAAMTSEWRFLSQIPEEVRLRAVDLLEEHKRPNDVYYDMAIRFLRNSSLPLEEYLKREDISNRNYSIRDIAHAVRSRELDEATEKIIRVGKFSAKAATSIAIIYSMYTLVNYTQKD